MSTVVSVICSVWLFQVHYTEYPPLFTTCCPWCRALLFKFHWFNLLWIRYTACSTTELQQTSRTNGVWAYAVYLQHLRLVWHDVSEFTLWSNGCDFRFVFKVYQDLTAVCCLRFHATPPTFLIWNNLCGLLYQPPTYHSLTLAYSIPVMWLPYLHTKHLPAMSC